MAHPPCMHACTTQTPKDVHLHPWSEQRHCLLDRLSQNLDGREREMGESEGDGETEFGSEREADGICAQLQGTPHSAKPKPKPKLLCFACFLLGSRPCVVCTCKEKVGGQHEALLHVSPHTAHTLQPYTTPHTYCHCSHAHIST